MPARHDDDVIYTLIKDEVTACAMELGVSKEQVAYGILKGMSRIVELELGHSWATDTSNSTELAECPLALDCYPSCAWWHNGHCVFQEELAIADNKMNKTKNPYPEFLIDKVSGVKVPDTRHEIWAAGYRAGTEDSRNWFGKYAGDDKKPEYNSKEASTSLPHNAIKATSSESTRSYQ